MISAKKLKKIIRRSLVLVVLCGLSIPVIIKGVQSIVCAWQERVEPLFKPAQVICQIHNIYSTELVHSLQAAVQDYATDRLIVRFKPEELYAKLKEQFKCVRTINYELLAPKTVKITIQGTIPRFVVNDHFVIGSGRSLLAASDFQDFNLDQLPHISVASMWCSQKLAVSAYDFVQKVPHDMWDRFAISFNNSSSIMLTPEKSVCPCKIIADADSCFDANKLEKINVAFNDLLKKELITPRLVASKECNILFDIRFDNRIYVKFLNRPRGGGRL